MKKKIQAYSRDFKMPHLFREDLENIEEIIKNELSPREYKLDFGSFEYQEIKEISEDTEPTNEFSIKVSSPYISIDFTKSSARIYAGDDDVKTVGAVKKITDIITNKERNSLWYFSKSSILLVPAIMVGFSILLRILDDKEIKLANDWLITSIVIILSIIFWTIGYQNNLNKFSVIEFVYGKNKLNFFTRNKDQIMVNIIVAVVSILATIFLQKVFK